MSSLHSLLVDLGACYEALLWAHGRPIAEESWLACNQGDWMLWIAVKIGVDRRLVVRAACACARQVLHCIPAGETRPLRAIETAEAWTRGETTNKEVRASRGPAYDYAACGCHGLTKRTICAASASYAASYSARVDGDVDTAANDAANAIIYVANAARYDTGGATVSFEKSARIVRELIPWSKIETALNKRKGGGSHQPESDE